MKAACLSPANLCGTTAINGAPKAQPPISQPTKKQQPPSHVWLWFQVIAQVRKEAEVREHDFATIAVTESTISSFLRNNGQDLKKEVDASLIARLDQALLNGGLALDPTITVTSTAKDLTALETRLRAMIRAYRGLLENDFSAVLRGCLKMSGLPYRVVAARLGVSVLKLKTWLANCSDFVLCMSPQQAVQLDGILRADGKLTATYSAMTQDMVYARTRSVMDQVLERKTFAQRLWECGQARQVTKPALVESVADLSGLTVNASVLVKWEQGLNVPCLEMRGAIAVLDDIYEAGGALLADWEAEDPQPTYSPYTLAFDRWPACVRDQFERLARYKVSNPEKLRRSPALSGDRWRGVASRNKWQAWCEHFFGFLFHVRKQPEASLSLTLIADWDLVESYLNFVRQRTGRSAFTQIEFGVASQLHNLYLFFLPSLAADAVREQHWIGRLPTVAHGLKEFVPGVLRMKETVLQGPIEGWCHHLALAARAARKFQNDNEFSEGSLLGKAQPLLEDEVGVARIADEVVRWQQEMPVRIRCLKAAILSRRMAVVALAIARNLRPANFLSLRLDQVEVTEGLQIKLNIDEAETKTQGQGASEGGVQGRLPDWDWIHHALWYYHTQGRPFLLRHTVARGGRDAGCFFTPGSAQAGQAMAAKSLQNDSTLILGYTLYAERYLFAHDAYGRGIPLEDRALNLLHSTHIHQRVYQQLTPKQKNRLANRHMEAMLLGH